MMASWSPVNPLYPLNDGELQPWNPFTLLMMASCSPVSGVELVLRGNRSRECIYSDGARDRKQIPGQESIIHLSTGFPFSWGARYCLGVKDIQRMSVQCYSCSRLHLVNCILWASVCDVNDVADNEIFSGIPVWNLAYIQAIKQTVYCSI
jgi:hypothetical protein